VEGAAATNHEKAVFGPNSVIWTNSHAGGLADTRKINRIDLGFTDTLKIAGKKNTQAAKSSLVEPPKRKF
jgi:hypothetical protein